METAEYWIQHLNLQPHQEGGFYREIFRSSIGVEQKELPIGYDGSRRLATSIYYLLRSGDVSRFHRLRSDEMWYYHYGSSIRIIIIDREGNKHTKFLGPRIEKAEQLQVEAGGILQQRVVQVGPWDGRFRGSGGKEGEIDDALNHIDAKQILCRVLDLGGGHQAGVDHVVPQQIKGVLTDMHRVWRIGDPSAGQVGPHRQMGPERGMESQPSASTEAELLVDHALHPQQIDPPLSAALVSPAESIAVDLRSEDGEHCVRPADHRTLVGVGELGGAMGAGHPQHEVEGLQMLFVNHEMRQWFPAGRS